MRYVIQVTQGLYTKEEGGWRRLEDIGPDDVVYERLGGGNTTNLQEAQVFGWGNSRKMKLARELPEMFRIIPVEIVIKE